MTFHPRGESSSSYWLHNEDWIDFNSFQSGHARRFNYIYRFLEHDRLLNPTKPTLDSEPAYEDIAIKFWEFCDWNNPMRVPTEVLNEDNLINDVSYFKNGFINDHDVRIHAYWNFLAGACGYTYGNNAIWQMFKKGGQIAIPALYDWRESMDRPGAFDIQNIRSLFEKYSLNNLVPDQSFIYGPNPDGEKHLQAAGSKDNSFALIYFAVGQSVNVVMGKIKGEEVSVTWFNTRDGSYSKSISIKNEGIVEFITPSIGKEEDWLLILESR